MRLQVSTDTTVEFYTLRGEYGPILSVPPPSTRPRLRVLPSPDLEYSPIVSAVVDPIAKLTRECSALRLKLATVERRERIARTAPPSARTPPHPPPLALVDNLSLSQRSAHDPAHARTSHLQTEVMKLTERYKALEKTLREMQDTLRAKDREIEALRAERDRLVAERDEARAATKSRSVSRERSRLSNGVHDDASSVASGNGAGAGNRPAGERQHRNRDRSRSRRHARRSDDAPPVPLGPAMTLEAEHYARARSMDVFLTKTDGWSGAQIIQAVDDLNAEISHFAAAATDSCSFAKRSRAKTASLVVPPELENCTPWLGPAFSRILALRDHAQDPILVQLALQASIAICCARSLSLFCVGFPSKLDALLTRILAHMQTSEPQATSSRWRALTHRSIRMLYPGLEEYAVTELVTTMLRWSSAIFALCGGSSGGSDASSVLPAQLRRIAEAVYKLARVTREEILSTTFEVLVVDGGTAFEPGKMLNKMREGEGDEQHPGIAEFGLGGANGNGVHVNGHRHGHGHMNGNGHAHAGVHPADSGKVLCTTELGLRCITRRDARNGVGESGVADAGGDAFESRMLLLPKVLLDTAMDVIERG
ncbi:hypothetical protein ACG7TL_007016 [Trametes sanguinea]